MNLSKRDADTRMDECNPERPYNSLPPLPPKAEIESRVILKACIGARAALGELKQAGGLLPNPTILVNTVSLLEARASSEIENIVTTTDRLFHFAQDERGGLADPATKETLRYRTALWRGFQSLKKRPLTKATAVEVCRTIKGVAWISGACPAPRWPMTPRVR